jgi:hypothetical protein
MWNTHSYFHATVILAPICMKELEDKLREPFFMTWIFEYLQFTCKKDMWCNHFGFKTIFGGITKRLNFWDCLKLNRMKSK